MPADGVARKKVAEELRNDAQAICFVAVNGVVILREHAFEKVSPKSVELAEALAD